MTIYTANLPWEVSAETVEALRGVGEVRFVFIVHSEDLDVSSRADVVRALDEEYGWRGLGESFWDDRLSGRRRRRS